MRILKPMMVKCLSLISKINKMTDPCGRKGVVTNFLPEVEIGGEIQDYFPFRDSRGSNRQSIGLVTQGCGFESRLRQELFTTEVRPLSKAPYLQTAPRAPHRQLPTASGVCTLGWVKSREHISLLVILCIIVYVTNKAHLSWIWHWWYYFFICFWYSFM